MGLGLTSMPPFKSLLLHSLVRENEGHEMVKSLNNVIPPLEFVNDTPMKDLEGKV